MLKPILMASVALLSSLMGQVNTEAMRGSSSTLGWSGALGGDFGLLAGNSQLLTVNSSMRIDHRSRWGHNFVAAKLGQGKSGDAEFSNKGFMHENVQRQSMPRNRPNRACFARFRAWSTGFR